MRTWVAGFSASMASCTLSETEGGSRTPKELARTSQSSTKRPCGPSDESRLLPGNKALRELLPANHGG